VSYNYDKLGTLLDLTGRRFGRLVVLRRVVHPGRTRWLCACDCGNETAVLTLNLHRDRGTRSCGCLMREYQASGRGNWKHGAKRSPEYGIWCAMKQRCCNPRNPAFARYGGRGITICDHWLHSFAAFLSDMGPRPSPTHSIDRIDNDQGYAPGNCRWATPTEQNLNTRQNVVLELAGQRLTLSQVAAATGLSVSRLHHRIKRHGPDSDLVLDPSDLRARRGERRSHPSGPE
jgi:hypothetical protein